MVKKFTNIIRIHNEGGQGYAIQKVPEGKDACRGCALNRRADCGVSCKELGGRLRKVTVGDMIYHVDGCVYVVEHSIGNTLQLLLWSKEGRDPWQD